MRIKIKSENCFEMKTGLCRADLMPMTFFLYLFDNMFKNGLKLNARYPFEI